MGHDIDFLAFMSQGLDEVNKLDRRQSSQSQELPDIDRRRSNVLDSLASSLVSKPQKQVIAIGAIIRSDGGLNLVVAENDDIPEDTADHLRGILADLRLVRAAWPAAQASRRIDFYLDNDLDPNSFNARLVALEHKVLQHSVLKIEQRFKKNNRNINFIRTAQDVLGDPSQQHVANRDERDTLDALRSMIETIDRSVDDGSTLELALDAVNVLVISFKTPKAMMTVAHVENISSALHFLRQWKSVLKRQEVFCDKWNKYTRQRLAAIGALIAGEKYDLLRWLSKVTVICDHFEEIASVATSNTLASNFISGPPPQIQILKKQTTASSISLDRNGLFEVLQAAGCQPEESDTSKADRFLKRLASAHHTTLVDDRKLVVSSKSPVHCECKVLAELHLQNAAPLIGVSKLSCAFCDIYFSAYHDVVGSRMCTAGCHDRSFTWAFPHLPPGQSDVDTNIRGQVRERLYARIKKGWAEYGQVSRNSMSTDASVESRAYNKKITDTLRLRRDMLAESIRLEMHADKADAP